MSVCVIVVIVASALAALNETEAINFIISSIFNF